jgi:hypothetical protein
MLPELLVVEYVDETSLISFSKPMASIEDLSTELFYEIFEYLNGCEIYESFSNLNIRFQNLLICSSQSLKIDLCSKSESMLQHYCRQVIIPNKNRIISLRLSNILIMKQFLALTSIDSSFSRLESLILNEIASDIVVPFFNGLISLPRLSSLILQFDPNFQNLRRFYRMMLNLPVLKYSKISSKSSSEYLLSSPTLDYGCISSLKHLIINHNCTINELLNILAYTPRLCYLTCKSIHKSAVKTRDVSINLFNLKYISFDNHNAYFNEFEIFFKQIHSQIQVLRFKTYENWDFVDANRWKQLISYHMPHLHRFYFQCSVTFDYELRSYQKQDRSYGFTSSFWIERQWIFELKTDVSKARRREMIYLIHPYR